MRKTILLLALLVAIMAAQASAVTHNGAMKSGVVEYSMSFLKVKGEVLEATTFETGTAYISGDTVKLERHIEEAELPDFFDSAGKKQQLAKDTVLLLSPGELVRYVKDAPAYSRFKADIDVHLMGRTFVRPDTQKDSTTLTCANYLDLDGQQVPQTIEAYTEKANGTKIYWTLRRTFNQRSVSAEEMAIAPGKNLEWLAYEKKQDGTLKIVATSEGAKKRMRATAKAPDGTQDVHLSGGNPELRKLYIPPGDPDGTLEPWHCDYDTHYGWYGLVQCCNTSCSHCDYYYLLYSQCVPDGWPYSNSCDYWNLMCFTYWPECQMIPISPCGNSDKCQQNGLVWYDYYCGGCCFYEDPE